MDREIFAFDDDHNLHGEYKRLWRNGNVDSHIMFKHGKYHGQVQSCCILGELNFNSFYVDNINITDEVEALVQDIDNLSEEEKMLIKLKWGIPCLNQ